MTYIATDLTLYAKIKTGTYTGDDTSDRAIAHGMGVKPKIVLIHKDTGDVGGFHMIDTKTIRFIDGNTVDYLTASAKNTTNFYIHADMNGNGLGYTWAAFA